jgi:imidazolonepropionase-like amidohydrolase
MRSARSPFTPLAGIGVAAGLVLLVGQAPLARVQGTPPAAPVHAKAASRLLIRNAMVIYGNGKPAFGPTDILLRDGLIARVGPLPRTEPPPDAVIDATGKYVMPGIVNAHMHLQDERGGIPQPFQYEANLLLACGVTTVRDVGSSLPKAKQWRAESAAHTLVAPRIQIYTPA